MSAKFVFTILYLYPNTIIIINIVVFKIIVSEVGFRSKQKLVKPDASLNNRNQIEKFPSEYHSMRSILVPKNSNGYYKNPITPQVTALVNASDT